MKTLYLFSFCLLTASLFSEENLLPTKQTYPVNKEFQQMENKAFRKEVTSQQTTTAASKGSTEVMIIEPSTRAGDFKEAYQYLRAQKSGSRVTFRLADGKSLSNVIDLDIMKGGSLVIFKMSTTSGLQFKVVRIEDITSIDHS